MNKNDPRLTGFVLGEISAEDAKMVKNAIHTDKQIAAEVATIEATVNQINDTFGNTQPKLTVEQRKKIFSSAESAEENIVKFSTKAPRKTGILLTITSIAALFIAIFSLSSDRGATSPIADFEGFTPELLSSRLTLPSKNNKAANNHIPANSLHSKELKKAISISPALFRNITKSITNPLPANTSTTSLNNKNESLYKSSDLPLTSGLSSWSIIKESSKTGTRLNPASIREEELANIGGLLPVFSYRFKGIDTALEFTQCPWDSNATLVVISLKNNTLSPINNVSANLAISEFSSSLKILGYPDTANGTLSAPTLYNFQPNHSHTLIAKIDFDQIPDSLSSLASLRISVGESSQKISYDFSLASLKIASNASTFPALTSYWAYYMKANDNFKSQHYPLLKQALEEFKEDSTQPQMIDICNILLQNI